MKPAEPSKLLSVNAAAERLGVSPFTIRAWIRQGRIEYVKLGRRVLLPESAIRHFVEVNTVPVREPETT